MNEADLPSDSDVSDEDYRPSGEESGAASEEESGPDHVEDLNEYGDDKNDDKNLNGINSKKSNRKTKKVIKRKGQKRKAPVIQEESVSGDKDVEEEKNLNPEAEKKKADSLWADFLKDCGEPAKKKISLDSNATDSSNCNSSNLITTNNVNNESTSLAKQIVEEKENKSTVTQIFEFAGEQIRVEKEVPTNSVVTDNGSSKSPVASFTGRGRGGRGGGGSSALTSFLGQLGKKGKLSTLEKSKLDWDQFKKNEGIEEDIQSHNRGKDGYLEKQDFLQRTDLRRFEIEKALRQKRSGR